jgi:hypothetical protein
MATWIAHLRITENLLQRIEGLDEATFAIGNVAPDSGVPDEKRENFTPPPEVSHFKQQSDGVYELADLEFYRQYLSPLQKVECDVKRFSFLLGYFFHLVVDNLWTREIGHPTQLRFADEFETDPEFIWEVKRDWYGLDLAYVRTHLDSLFWRVFLSAEYEEDYLEFLPRSAVQQRISYIKDLYRRTDEDIENWYGKRPDKYLSQQEMDDFIQLGTQVSMEAFSLLWDQRAEPSGYASVLEMDLGSDSNLV